MYAGSFQVLTLEELQDILHSCVFDHLPVQTQFGKFVGLCQQSKQSFTQQTINYPVESANGDQDADQDADQVSAPTMSTANLVWLLRVAPTSSQHPAEIAERRDAVDDEVLDLTQLLRVRALLFATLMFCTQ